MPILINVFSLILLFVFMFCISVLLLRVLGIQWAVEPPTVDDLLTIALASLSSLFLLAGGGMALSHLGLAPTSKVNSQASTELVISVWIIGVSLAPIAEEFLFRGAIQGGLRSRFGAVTSITAGCSLFAVAHTLNYSGTVIEVFSAVVLIGLVSVPFAISYELTDNLTIPIASHALYNLIFYLILFSAA